MPKRKRKQTLDFVKGLLLDADKIDELIPSGTDHPRETLHGDTKIKDCCPEQLLKFGQYQGRVVLAALAAELALKFAWEKENPEGGHAKGRHCLHQLFKRLSTERKGKIRNEYATRLTKANADPPKKWKTADKVFETCNRSFEHWRYIVEEDSFENYIMQATYLIEATRSVIDTQLSLDAPSTKG